MKHNPYTKMNPHFPIDPPCFDTYPEDDDHDVVVPGIDECDHLFSLTSRCGDFSVYTRVQEDEDGKFHAALSVDTPFFADGLPADRGPHNTPREAFLANLETSRGWFKDNSLQFVYCDDARRAVRSSKRTI